MSVFPSAGQAGGAWGSDIIGQGLASLTTNAAKQQWGIFRVAQRGILTKSWEVTNLGRSVSFYRNMVKPNIDDLFPFASVIRFDVQQDYIISEAPQEDGQFLSYNKVKKPLRGSVKYICDGSQSGRNLLYDALPSLSLLGDNGSFNRALFLQTLEDAKASLETFQLRTPEYGWTPVNIIGSRMNRAPDSISMLEVEVMVQEIRDTAQIAFTETALPDGAKMQELGNVQPTDADPLVSRALETLAP